MITYVHSEALRALSCLPANVFDALVTDPPAGVDFMGKDWDCFRRTRNPADVGRDNVFGRASRTAPHSYGESDRGEFIEMMRGIFAETLRVLKPGAHGLVWALPRTAHWTATALEDAGFEIRDRIHDLAGTDGALETFLATLDDGQLDALARILESQTSPILHHLFLSGMPKGQGDIRRVLDMHYCTLHGKHCDKNLPAKPGRDDHICPSSNEPLALAREGYSTGLKPTVEHWILVRKPLDGTQAQNQVRWGTGALNTGATSIPVVGGVDSDARWPRHAVLTHAAACREGACVLACPVALLDAQAGVRTSGANNVKRHSSAGREGNTGPALGAENRREGQVMVAYGDSGAASRMFSRFKHDVVYVAKASVAEKERGLEETRAQLMDTGRTEGSLGGSNPRNRGARKRKNTHPTVKPVALMRHLIRTVTPAGGSVLDPFAGTGTTLLAAREEGCDALGIERELEYVEIGRKRLAVVG